MPTELITVRCQNKHWLSSAGTGVTPSINSEAVSAPTHVAFHLLQMWPVCVSLCVRVSLHCVVVLGAMFLVFFLNNNINVHTSSMNHSENAISEGREL